MRLPMGSENGISIGRVCLAEATPANAQVILNAIEQDHAQNLSFFSGQRVTLTRQRQYLRKIEKSEQDLLFLILHADSRELIGTAGLHEIDHANKNARLGLLIFREQDRGKGYGTEAIRALHEVAFRVLKLHKLYVRILVANEKARKKYADQLGYREEGLLREEYYLRGAFHDMRVLSLLQNEWSERAPVS